MNKNRENYKKAIDQIHVDSDLKDKVLEKAKEKNKNPIYYLRYAVGIAAIVIVAVIGVSFVNDSKQDNLKYNSQTITKEEKTEALASINIKRFENIEELRDMLKENETTLKNYYNGMVSIEESAVDDLAKSTNTATQSSATRGISEEADYSKTNNQVENVDEADIVKTDGKYIYYCQNNRIYVVDKDLNLKTTIKDDDFSPTQIFINGERLVVFGRKYSYSKGDILVYNTRDFEDFEELEIEDNEEDIIEEDISTIYRPKSLVRVYNLSNIEKPEIEREISIDGNYRDARMIDNNIYLISQYSIYSYYYRGIDELKDIDLLPSYEDSLTSKVQYINATDIACFGSTRNTTYCLIAGFDLNSTEKVNIETFFGAGDNIYVSENNMYVVATEYEDWYASKSKIYKFRLENANILAVAECDVEGYVNNQFSIDEYEGNLRIATTIYKNNYRGLWYEDFEETVSTRLTIFNEELEKIGEIEDLVKDERIYAVRFIGEIGYIVTFEEIDPLWVIDLSNPENPVIKGALEIPGYSSYLHPYDETHIIGIGYNVKDNGYGGVTNDTMKLSMFDVSDLNNPREIFNISMSQKAYSSITYDHKALFFNKEENLIGFPVYVYDRGVSQVGVILYRIDLENNKFEEITDLLEKTNTGSVWRSIYIGDSLYTLYIDKIVKYDMTKFEEIGKLELEFDNRWYW